MTSLNESAQDITAEYVDVEARLKALNDQRDRLNALADKAETTADLLEIEPAFGCAVSAGKLHRPDAADG